MGTRRRPPIKFSVAKLTLFRRMRKVGDVQIRFHHQSKRQTQCGACNPPGYVTQTWRRTYSEAVGEPKLTIEHPLD